MQKDNSHNYTVCFTLGKWHKNPCWRKAELMNGPYLDLAPHYQRGVVWPRKAMRLLIDSMWKGYYIPPVRTWTNLKVKPKLIKIQVIFNLEIVKDEDGGMRFKRTCVDGKQVKFLHSSS